MPNFVFGLGYGLLDEKSLVNIDAKVNIPIDHYLSTQVFLNSNYLMTGSAKNSFAQSEFSSNWFISNESGRIGLGLGVNELEPLDENQETDRNVIWQFIGDLFVDSFALTTHYVSSDAFFSNVTSSKIGIGYYLHDDQRISFFRENYGTNDDGWRLETYYQPKKYRQMGSVGFILRASEDINYVGAVVQYYFDHTVSLKQREIEFH